MLFLESDKEKERSRWMKCLSVVFLCRTAEIETLLWISGIVIRERYSAWIFFTYSFHPLNFDKIPRKLQRGAISLHMRVNMNSVTSWSFVAINLAKFLTGKNQLTVVVSLETFRSQSMASYGNYAIWNSKRCVSAWWITDACICSTNNDVYFTNSTSL